MLKTREFSIFVTALAGEEFKHRFISIHQASSSSFCAYDRAATRDFLPRHYHIIDASSVHHGVNEAASTVFLMKSGITCRSRIPK